MIKRKSKSVTDLATLIEAINALLSNKENAEAQARIQAGLEKFPNQVNLLTIATNIYRASGNREKTLEFSQQLISHHPDNWFGYGRAAEELVALNRFDEAQHQIQQGLEKLPNQVNLLTIAINIYRASGNREKSLEFSQQLISHHPNNWLGYADSAKDLAVLKRFDEAQNQIQAGLEIFSNQINIPHLASGQEILEDISFSITESLRALTDYTSSAHISQLREFACCSKGSNVEIYPIGNGCRAATFLQDAKIRSKAMPFDWLRCDENTIKTIIDDEFKNFLAVEHLHSQYPDRKCWHWLYGSGVDGRLFGHHDPSREPDRSAFIRRVERFKLVLKDEKPILFLNVGGSVAGIGKLLDSMNKLSRVVLFNFAPAAKSCKPVLKRESPQLLTITFFCNVQDPLASKKAERKGHDRITDGRRIYCQYSNTYAHAILGLIGKQPA